MTIGIRLRRVPALALVVGLLAGCVYYNGMYNTNRLVRSARKAERENRPFEASNLWGQVITRAESVSVRHPHSKYAPQANVLRGLALSRLNQCQQAVIPLAQVALLPPGDFAEEAVLALGRCQMETGDPASADLAFRQLLDSRDEVHRRQARFEHGRALRMTGHYDEAIPFLRETTGPRAGDELLLALSGAGHDDEADSLVTLLLASGDSTRVWDSLVVAMARQRPGSADSLIDRLATQPGTSAAQRARRMYDEALRLETVDSARYLARLRQAATVGMKSEGGQQATLRLFRLQIAQAEAVAALAPIADSLEAFSGMATAVTSDASQLASAVDRVRSASDSGAAGIPQGDLRLFLAAESSRDSLLAPRENRQSERVLRRSAGQSGVRVGAWPAGRLRTSCPPSPPAGAARDTSRCRRSRAGAPRRTCVVPAAPRWSRAGWRAGRSASR